MEENVQRIVRVLRSTGVAWAVIGAHAVDLYTRPRATEDLDIVVDARRLKTVLAALHAEYGDIEVTDIGPALRLPAISLDIIRSDMQPVFHKAVHLAVDHGGLPVAPAELLVVLKYLAAISPWRSPEDRQQDASDLIRLVRTLGEALDRETVLQHAQGVFPGAQAELAALLQRIDRGETIVL